MNVFAGFLHAHLLGREIVLSHQRAGLELSPMMRDDSYDFNYQDLRALRPERQVLGVSFPMRLPESLCIN